jgi:hypothetical protein
LDNSIRFKTKGTLSEFEILELQEQNHALYLEEKERREKLIRDKICPNRLRAKIVLQELKGRYN